MPIRTQSATRKGAVIKTPPFTALDLSDSNRGSVATMLVVRQTPTVRKPTFTKWRPAETRNCIRGDPHGALPAAVGPYTRILTYEQPQPKTTDAEKPRNEAPPDFDNKTARPLTFDLMGGVDRSVVTQHLSTKGNLRFGMSC